MEELQLIKSDSAQALDSSPGSSAPLGCSCIKTVLTWTWTHWLCWVTSRGECFTENVFIGSEKNILDDLFRSTSYMHEVKEYYLPHHSAVKIGGHP